MYCKKAFLPPELENTSKKQKQITPKKSFQGVSYSKTNEKNYSKKNGRKVKFQKITQCTV